MNTWKMIGLLGGLALVFLVVTTVSASNDYNNYQEEAMIYEIEYGVELLDQTLIEVSVPDRIEVYETDGSSLEIHYKKGCNSQRQMDQYEEAFEIEESEKGVSITMDPIYDNWLYENWLAKLVTGLDETEGILRLGIPASYEADVYIVGSSGALTLKDLTLGHVTLKTSSGRLEVADLMGQEIDLSSSSGSLSANNIQSDGPLSIETSSGRLSGDILIASNVTVKASSGSVTLNEVTAKQEMGVSTSSGNQTLTNIIVGGDLDIEVSSGRLTLKSIEAKNLELRGSSGRIEAEEVTTKTTTADISSGNLSLEGALGKIQIDGGSGNIEVASTTYDDLIEIEASSGNVDLYLPEAAEFEAYVEISSGVFDSNFSLNEKEDYDGYDLYAYTIDGKVGFKIYLKTSSGNIDLFKSHE